MAEYVEGIFKQDQFTLKSEIAGSEAAIQCGAEDRRGAYQAPASR